MDVDSVSATQKMKVVQSTHTAEQQSDQISVQINEPMGSVSATQKIKVVQSTHRAKQESNQNSVQSSVQTNGPIDIVSET